MLILTLTGGSSSPDRYGQNVVDVIHELSTRGQPEVISNFVTSCKFDRACSGHQIGQRDQAGRPGRPTTTPASTATPKTRDIQP
jgi:hypothetical protein